MGLRRALPLPWSKLHIHHRLALHVMLLCRQEGSPFDLHVTSWVSESDIDVFGQFLHMESWPITRHRLPLLDIFSSQEESSLIVRMSLKLLSTRLQSMLVRDSMSQERQRCWGPPIAPSSHGNAEASLSPLHSRRWSSCPLMQASLSFRLSLTKYTPLVGSSTAVCGRD